MDIILRHTFSERDAVSLLNWLARCNARLLKERPDLPLLYEAGVRYEREEVETWCDILQLFVQRWEDCDGLSAARAGELMARGYKALAPDEPGYTTARRLRLASIPSQVCLTTHVLPGEHGQYHCITRYVVGAEVHWDDPSARLGMFPVILSAVEAEERVKTRTLLDRKGKKGLPATLDDRRRHDPDAPFGDQSPFTISRPQPPRPGRRSRS